MDDHSDTVGPILAPPPVSGVVRVHRHFIMDSQYGEVEAENAAYNLDDALHNSGPDVDGQRRSIRLSFLVVVGILPSIVLIFCVMHVPRILRLQSNDNVGVWLHVKRSGRDNKLIS